MNPRSIRVRVTPRAKRPGIEIEPDGTWRVRVAAPAQDGRANEAVIAAIAERLGVPKSALRMTHGFSGRLKRVEIPA